MRDTGSEMKSILGRAINRPPFSVDPKFSHLQYAEIGDPVPLYRPEMTQDSWIVPFVVDKLVCGIALMSLHMEVRRISVFGSRPADRARWFELNYFERPPAKYYEEVLGLHPEQALSKPLLTFDRTPTKWGWRIQITEDGSVFSNVFIGPRGWYERKVRDEKKGYEGS
jgi:hypothetical protein